VEPLNDHDWESQYTFNPAAVYREGKVHLVYRAIGDHGISVLGYAASRNGINVDERLVEPVYIPREPFEYSGRVLPDTLKYLGSGGGFGGCEDPRLTELGDEFYMTYTAFNCYPRVALTSIKKKDFLSKNWKWRPAVLISPPGEVHKNWVIFPEKINGKYAILHGISPDILIDYFDNLNFDGKTFIKSKPPNGEVRAGWDSRVRGVGPPPLKTEDGWLVIYHAIDDRDPGKYKIGAMILDYKDPKKILYRSASPILEPDEVYENEGFKSGIVYSCGAVIKDYQLYVYYGGADTVVCVARVDLEKFLNDLKTTGNAKLGSKQVISRKRHAGR
jgi:predicted GH43/DUF377 family glycosyl hydrolase